MGLRGLWQVVSTGSARRVGDLCALPRALRVCLLEDSHSQSEQAKGMEGILAEVSSGEVRARPLSLR